MRLLALALLTLPTIPISAQAPTTPTMVVDFGGAVDDPAAELLQVRGVVRTSTGQFAVANGKPSEFRLYDARGNLVRVLARRGGGPGEYGYGITPRPWAGDSVVGFGQGNDRWMLFSLRNGFVRDWAPSEATPQPATWPLLHGSAMIRRSVVGSAGCPSAAIERFAPRSAADLQEAMSDPAGRLWLHRFGTRDWTVHEPSGSVAARFRLPAGFVITHFDGDRVVGVYQDDDGFPHVTMFRTGLPVRSAASTADCASIPIPVDKVRAAQIKTAMRNAMTVNEAYYSDHRTYPTKAGDYPSAMMVSGTEFTVQGADAESYAFTITDKATGWRCMVRVGRADPELDGVLLCGT
ncbi:MAG TPA: hypothetical protein VFN22_13800 [Gemmatimonadales bacterium]|nr:hypothetical protein [Gemmatimonadales bacterium]